jgi:hypothetical protein
MGFGYDDVRRRSGRRERDRVRAAYRAPPQQRGGVHRKRARGVRPARPSRLGFLVSDRAAWITVSNLIVDGGQNPTVWSGDTRPQRGEMKMGIQIFQNVREAISAGFTIVSPIPDSEGYLHARIRTAAGWAIALVSIK